MRPKKEFIERLKNDRTLDRINNVLSLAYLLQSKAYMLYDEADELLRNGGLLMGETKKYSNKLRKSFDEYFNDFKSLITNESTLKSYFKDLDDFSRMVHVWAELPVNFTPEKNKE